MDGPLRNSNLILYITSALWHLIWIALNTLRRILSINNITILTINANFHSQCIAYVSILLCQEAKLMIQIYYVRVSFPMILKWYLYQGDRVQTVTVLPKFY